MEPFLHTPIFNHGVCTGNFTFRFTLQYIILLENSFFFFHLLLRIFIICLHPKFHMPMFVIVYLLPVN